MKFRPNKILGLAVGEKSILIAEVVNVADRRQVTRAGEFVYPTGITLQQPQELGAALGQYLKREGFSARSAIVGIPARWVLTKVKELPPVDPTMAADMLRLQAESEFSPELKDLIHDFAGESNAGHAAEVLLVATPRQHVDQIQALASAARIEVTAITPTTLVLGAATTRGDGEALVLCITRSGTELMAQRGGGPALLRHIGSGSSVNALVAGEVRRASLQLVRHNSAGNGSANGQASVVIWNDSGIERTTELGAANALGPTARDGRWDDLGAGDPPNGAMRPAAAVALAMAAMSPIKLPVDFLHPRLAEPKKTGIPRQTVLAIAAGVMVIVGVIFAVVNLQSQEAELAAKRVQLDGMAKDRKAAEEDVAKIKFAQGWHADKPRISRLPAQPDQCHSR